MSIDGFEGVKVNGNVVSIDAVNSVVSKHMGDLKKAGKFSEEELVVQLSFPGMKNAIYIDLPGFPDIKSAHYDQTVSIIHSAVSNPETIIVALMNAGKTDPVSLRNCQSAHYYCGKCYSNLCYSHCVIFYRKPTTRQLSKQYWARRDPTGDPK